MTDSNCAMTCDKLVEKFQSGVVCKNCSSCRREDGISQVRARVRSTLALEDGRARSDVKREVAAARQQTTSRGRRNRPRRYKRSRRKRSLIMIQQAGRCNRQVTGRDGRGMTWRKEGKIGLSKRGGLDAFAHQGKPMQMKLQNAATMMEERRRCGWKEMRRVNEGGKEE